MTGVDVRAEQIRTVYRQTGAVLLANCVNSAIVGAVLWRSVATPLVLAWLTAMFLMCGARVWLNRRYLRAKPAPSQAEAWGARFAIGSATSGVLWGASALLLLTGSGSLPELLVSFVIGGMCAAAAGTLASYFPAFLAFIIPSLLSLSVCMACFGDTMHAVMSGMVLIYAAGLMSVARVNHRVLTEAFSLRFEKAQLLDRLSATQRDLEDTNRTLEQRVAERSEALRKQSDALRDAQRMESIGRLAGSVAHDFNNLLTVILINLSDLLQRSGLDEATKNTLREIRDAANKGADLIRQLLMFSRRQRALLETLDLNQVVRAMDKLLGRLLGEELTLKMQLQDAPLFVHVDSTQLEQIVINLVTNARDAMLSGGAVTVETRTVELAGPWEGIAPGTYALLSVRDTGIGMDATTRERVFEPFFTTKEIGKGTGLGLATVHSIVEQSGGHIRVTSEPSQGSCFQVYFSLAAPAQKGVGEAPLRAGSGVRKAVKATSNITVLLVEDEPIVRAVARRLLESAGYRVLCAESGERALALSSAHTEPIELLITDVVMSGLDGPSLATRLRAERPGLRTLFISGFSQDHAVPQENLADGIGFLPKPFSYDSLTTKVAELLATNTIAKQPASGSA